MARHRASTIPSRFAVRRRSDGWHLVKLRGLVPFTTFTVVAAPRQDLALAAARRRTRHLTTPKMNGGADRAWGTPWRAAPPSLTPNMRPKARDEPFACIYWICLPHDVGYWLEYGWNGAAPRCWATSSRLPQTGPGGDRGEAVCGAGPRRRTIKEGLRGAPAQVHVLPIHAFLPKLHAPQASQGGGAREK